MMKIILKIIATSALFLTFSGAQAASALVLDTYIGRAAVNSSGDNDEVLLAAIDHWEATGNLYNFVGDWFSVPDADTSDLTKVENAGVVELTYSEFGYVNVLDKPSYFVLKFGSGQNDYDLFFFKNEMSYNQLVWNNEELSNLLCGSVEDFGVTKCDDKSKKLGLSHYIYSGDVSEVPLPAAVWLFGSAFAGLMGVARKRTKVA